LTDAEIKELNELIEPSSKTEKKPVCPKPYCKRTEFIKETIRGLKKGDY
jgi:23S rRNA pseudouridine2604 synthase